MTSQNRLGCLSILLFLALCFSLFLNFFFLVLKGARSSGLSTRTTPKFEESVVQAGEDGTANKIAEIFLRGIITGSEPGRSARRWSMISSSSFSRRWTTSV